MTFFIPNTPRWQTLFKNNDKAAIRTLRQIYEDDQKAESVLNQIKSADVNSINNEKLIAKTNNKIIALAFLISFFNQLSGINFYTVLCPEILEMAGFGTKASLFNSVLIGVIMIIFTFLGLLFIDRLGRRQLLILGSLGYILSLTGVSMSFYFQSSPEWIAFYILIYSFPRSRTGNSNLSFYF